MSEDVPHRMGFGVSRIAVYGALALWAFVCLFPIFWAVTTSFKTAPDVTQGRLIPFIDWRCSTPGSASSSSTR